MRQVFSWFGGEDEAGYNYNFRIGLQRQAIIREVRHEVYRSFFSRFKPYLNIPREKWNASFETEILVRTLSEKLLRELERKF